MNTKLAFAIGLSVLMILGVTIASFRNANAHTFSGDESASFLATVEVIKVHLDLAKKDFATNATMAAEHAEHAREHLTNDTIKEITEKNQRLGTELPASLDELHEALENGTATAVVVDQQVADINDLLGETVTVRIENAQLTNSTIQGTMLANLVDEVLESYNGAYGIEGEEHEDEGGSMNMTGEADNETTEEGEHNAIVNMMDYESAQALAARAQELFDTKLKAMAIANETEAIVSLDAGLKKLKQAIDDKAPHDDVDVIVHADIHPNIQSAYNLQVIPEFPLPIIAVVMGITSIVVYSRIRGIKRLQ